MRRLLAITHCVPGGTPSQGAFIANQLSKSGVPTGVLSEARTGWGRLLDIALNGLKRIAQCDVLLVNIYGYRAFVYEALAILYGYFFRKRVVAFIHGGWMPEFVAEWPHLTHWVLSKTDLILTPHDFLKERLTALGVKVDGTIPNSIDIEDYHFRLRSKLAPRFLYLRGTHPIYHPEMALRAFALIQRRYPQASLTMAGKDFSPYSRNCRELARDLELRNINFVGIIPKEQISDLANEHDLYIQTNRIDNFPVTVIEMWAAGLPVVSTDVGGMPYLIRNNKDGILVKSEDYRGMADVCLELLNNPQLAGKLSTNGRKRAEDLTWDKIAPEWRRTLLLDGLIHR
jgi:glycosyltransferase involved in cell wall biosynthesis